MFAPANDRTMEKFTSPHLEKPPKPTPKSTQSTRQVTPASTPITPAHKQFKKSISISTPTISTPKSGVKSGAKKPLSKVESQDEWDEIREDPVGECIAAMLNEGKVRYFGYVPQQQLLLNGQSNGQLNGQLGASSCTAMNGSRHIKLLYPHTNEGKCEGFGSPLLSIRNYRALKSLIHKLFEFGTSDRLLHGNIWFLIETLAAAYITIYSLNDVMLRYAVDSLALMLFGILSTIVDMNEVQYALLLLFQQTPLAFQQTVFKTIYSIHNKYTAISSSLLHGHRFSTRTLLWTSSSRLQKFRRKHLNIMKLHTERRLNRRQRKKYRIEQRKKERKGQTLEESEFVRLNAEMLVKETLDSQVEELRRKPPTYFPNTIHVNIDPTASEMTQRHLTSLQYCHSMIFRPKEKDVKPVSITTQRRESALSPREAIEVLDFPPLNIDKEDELSTTETVSSSASKYSLPQYILEECDYVNSSEEDSSDDGEEEEEEDELSQTSHASEEAVKKMDWIAVGAKIGTKILNSRQVHRVIANPSRPLIKEEGKKEHVDEIEKAEVSMSKTSTFDSQFSKVAELDVAMSEDTKSTESSIPKPPVHGMWTSAGAAAISSSYGAVAFPDSNLSTPRNMERNVYVSSAQEAVELMRESSDGTVDKLNQLDTSNLAMNGSDRSGSSGSRGSSSSKSLDLSSPYDLRLVSSMPTPSTPTNNVTPKASNVVLVSSKTPPRTSLSMSRSESTTRLAPMEKGVKIVVPMFAPNVNNYKNRPCFFQMGTVISSQRITVPTHNYMQSPERPRNKKFKWSLINAIKDETNCLAIKLVLDKAILRGSKFAEMNIRIMDEWNFTPRYSKYPIGSCVATTFGVGVLVGWRVEDDMHIIRSLWNRSGPGSGLAYLRRECLHSIVEAAVGFDVETRLGSGHVKGYVRGGKEHTDGKYFVHLKSKGRYQDRVVEFKRNQILSCRVAKFIPVTEHIRAAALYQLEILHYKAKVREHMLNDPGAKERGKGGWRKFSEYVDLFAASLSKAISEDPDFDRELDKFISHIIDVLDDTKDTDDMSVSESVSTLTAETDQTSVGTDHWNMGNMQDIFASFFVVEAHAPIKTESDNKLVLTQVHKAREVHDSIAIILRVLLRTVAVARASVPDRPKLHIALAMIHEALLFVRQIVRVNKNNISKPLIEAWFRTLNEISRTFGPLKERSSTLGKKIAKKMKKHSDIAKKRILSFVDIVLGDTLLLHALERGDWKQTLLRVEYALVKASITDEATCEQLHKGVILLYKNLAPRKKDRASKAAAKRTEVKALQFAKVMKVLASPGRSFLRLLAADDVLELFGRVLLRVFDNDPECSMMINIYAFNFESLRYLRTLNNMSVSARLWETVLDAVDEELTFVASQIPDQTKYFVEPFINLFSLGVAKFHCIQAGNSNADWLDFLLEEDAVKIIQEIDMKIIDCLDAFCKDVKQLFEVMPYIKTFDNDILDLMDELDFDLMFKEVSGTICDPEKFTVFMTERTAILVERFLDYLPRMSIPIEKRALQDGWVLTCRSSDGGDLRLSDINVKRENLLCKVLGSENVFQPLGEDDFIGSPKQVFPEPSFDSHAFDKDEKEDEDGCVLDEAREMILSAQKYGCWVPGLGGLKEPHYYLGVPYQLEDLPLSESLKTGIDLWQSSAISDFEFTQIVIKEVSSNIELHSRDETFISPGDVSNRHIPNPFKPFKPFNPKIDATALLLEIKNLTLHLDEFIFRVEKGENKTIFDPVFEGAGSLTVKNVCISLRVEVKKQRLANIGHRAIERPLFQLTTFDISLEKLTILFKDTGADWVLNTVLKGFRDQITQVVQDNVKDQIKKQVHIALDHVNAMFDANPDLLLTILGISLEDLDEIDQKTFLLYH